MVDEIKIIKQGKPVSPVVFFACGVCEQEFAAPRDWCIPIAATRGNVFRMVCGNCGFTCESPVK